MVLFYIHSTILFTITRYFIMMLSSATIWMIMFLVVFCFYLGRQKLFQTFLLTDVAMLYVYVSFYMWIFLLSFIGFFASDPSSRFAQIHRPLRLHFAHFALLVPGASSRPNPLRYLSLLIYHQIY